VRPGFFIGESFTLRVKLHFPEKGHAKTKTHDSDAGG
jgi:hypothetical protein